MDLRQIENFIEICNQLSITRAAQNMYISQQGMSKSMRSLEHELGVQLFTRTASGITLTEYGREFETSALELESVYRRALERIASIKNRSKNDITIGIPHGLTNVIGLNILQRFVVTHSEANVSVKEYNDSELDKLIEDGLLDIGFCIEPISHAKLDVHRVHYGRVYYMLPEGSPYIHDSKVDLRELKDESFVGFGGRGKGHRQLLEHCHRAGFDPKTNYETQDFGFITELCRQGAGVGFYAGEITDSFPGITLAEDMFSLWSYNVCICTKKGNVLSKLEKEFLTLFDDWSSPR